MNRHEKYRDPIVEIELFLIQTEGLPEKGHSRLFPLRYLFLLAILRSILHWRFVGFSIFGLVFYQVGLPAFIVRLIPKLVLLLGLDPTRLTLLLRLTRSRELDRFGLLDEQVQRLLDVAQLEYGAYERVNLGRGQDAESSPPLLSESTLLLEAHFLSNAYHETGLHLNDLVLSILGDHLIALLVRVYLLFFLVSHGVWQQRLGFIPQYVVVILSLPATGADFEEVVCEGAAVFPRSHGRQIAERSIDDGHLDLGGKET